MRPCPLCETPDPARSIDRGQLPIFQNVVYASQAEAIAAPRGPFALATCHRCGFSYNGWFDAALAIYDERYDNEVVSSRFERYYREQATMMIARFGLKQGTVYDVGCGNGAFLRTLCEMAPDIEGVGIDPSCSPLQVGNFRLVKDIFRPDHFAADGKLVILRHVLEHLSEPVAFLSALREAAPVTPLYVEVPDLDWILDQGAFWDFCYEHCNYFTLPTLAFVLGQAGYRIDGQSRSFGDQYQWAIGTPDRSAMAHLQMGAAQARVADYARGEAGLLEALRARADGGGVALWGMATKGVMLSDLLGPERVLGGIDMNPAKQGRFAAASGAAIHAPEWLRDRPPGTLVFVMNPNYLDEIRAIAARIGSNAVLASI